MTDEQLPDTVPPQSTPQVPKIDHAPTTAAEVQELAAAFAAFRADVAALRAEMKATRGPQKFVASVVDTLEERTKRRVLKIAQHSHYCPGCGALYDYPQKCVGTREGPHLPIEVVSTNELAGDPATHTAAPNTDVLAA